MRIRLESVTPYNVADIRAVSASSTSFFYGLPTNDWGERALLDRAQRARAAGYGDDLAAYDADASRRLVGGGLLLEKRDAVSVGYWVASELRGQGIGRSVLQAIELEAIARFPDKTELHADIDPENEGSQLFAEKMGYGWEDGDIEGPFMVWRKPVSEVLAQAVMAETATALAAVRASPMPYRG